MCSRRQLGPARHRHPAHRSRLRPLCRPGTRPSGSPVRPEDPPATLVKKAIAVGDDQAGALAPTPEVAVTAGLLDARSFPGDPVDRLIYATARSVGAILITRDEAIRAFDPTTTLW
jgi:predicted nucleic acid-binding protein